MANPAVQATGAATRAAAAAAAGSMGFDKTVTTSPSGADTPALATKSLLGT